NAERAQYVRGLDTTALTRGAPRSRNAPQIERHQQRLAVGAGNRDVGDVGRPRCTATMNDGIRDLRKNSRLQAVAQLLQARAVCLTFCNREFRRAGEANRGSDIFRPGSASTILAAAVHQGLEMNTTP